MDNSQNIHVNKWKTDFSEQNVSRRCTELDLLLTIGYVIRYWWTYTVFFFPFLSAFVQTFSKFPIILWKHTSSN